MSDHFDLEQLRKRAKERVRARRAAGDEIKLSAVQLELANEHGFASWPRLKEHVERLGAEQPFRTDLDYYEGRAEGTVRGVELAEARQDLARRHGFPTWNRLVRHVEALRDGSEPPTPFMQAYDAVEAGDRNRLEELLDRHPDLIRVRGTNGNDLLGMPSAGRSPSTTAPAGRTRTAAMITAGRSCTRRATATTGRSPSSWSKPAPARTSPPGETAAHR